MGFCTDLKDALEDLENISKGLVVQKEKPEVMKVNSIEKMQY